MKMTKTVLPATALALASLVMAGAPAHAANRSDACGSYACGSATITSWSPTRVTLTESVRDTYCNRFNSYVHLKVFYTNGTFGFSTMRHDQIQCDGAYTSWSGLAFSVTDGRRIKSVQARVGDDGGWAVGGTILDNPTT